MTHPFLSQKDQEFVDRTIYDWTVGGSRSNSAIRFNRNYSAIAARWFLEGNDVLQMIANEDYEKGKV